MSKHVPLEVSVHGGLCRLVFSGPSCTGMDIDANPGVSFTFVSESVSGRMIPIQRGAKTELCAGMGVIGRSDLARMIELFQTFLNDYPVVTGGQQATAPVKMSSTPPSDFPKAVVDTLRGVKQDFAGKGAVDPSVREEINSIFDREI